MRTIIPHSNLKQNSWAEDFTPYNWQRQKYMFVQCTGHYYALPTYAVLNREKLHSYLLLYTVKGTGIIQYRQKERRLPAGYAAVINCNEKHSYFCAPNDEWDLRWIHFSGNCITGYLTELIENWDAIPLENGEARLMALYEKAEEDGQICAIELSSMLISLCSDLLICHKKKAGTHGSSRFPACKERDSNPGRTPI